MHVLQLGPYPPPEGGVSRNMLAIRDELISAGHTCSIIVTARSSDDREQPDVYRPRSPIALVKLLRTLRYDVLHLHVGGDVSPRVLAMAFACVVIGHGPKVLTLHSGAYPLTDAARSARRSSLRGIVFRRFDRLIAVNEQLADVFRRYGADEDRIKVVLPYALGHPDKNVAIPADLRAFCADHKPMLLSVGGLERDYDPLFQIAAMTDILAEFPQAGLMIVGDGSMRKEVEKAVAESGHAEHICIAGNVEHAVTLHLINDADMLLRTTLFDGDAISVREALFLGTHVIATDNGMRPAGAKLIAVGDYRALVDEVIAVSGRRKPDQIDPIYDNANIDAVIGIYRELV